MQNFVISIAQIAMFEVIVELLFPTGQMKNAVSSGVGITILYVIVSKLIGMFISVF